MEEVKKILSEAEVWEMVTYLYLNIQQRLFTNIYESNRFIGTEEQLLNIIVNNDKMIAVVKNAMFLQVCKEDVEESVEKSVYKLNYLFKNKWTTSDIKN